MGRGIVADTLTFENIPYYSPDGIDTLLDVHVPADGAALNVPTVLFLHGGGWYSGDKSDSPELWMPLVEEGYSVVSCNYTLSSEMSPSYPQAVHDVKAVVRWIRTIGTSKYNCSSTIVVMGPSAGGHLTEMLATTSGVEIFEPLPSPETGYKVQAAIPFFGLCDFVMQVKAGGNTSPFAAFLGGELDDKTRPTYVEASPRTWVSSEDTPMFHVHGFDDPIHFRQQAIVMNQILQKAEVYSDVYIYDGGHAFADISYGGFNGYDAAAEILIEQIPVLLREGRNADVNLDGYVNVEDLLALISSWGDCPELPVDCASDLDGNGAVSVSDLLLIIDQWG